MFFAHVKYLFYVKGFKFINVLNKLIMLTSNQTKVLQALELKISPTQADKNLIAFLNNLDAFDELLSRRYLTESTDRNFSMIINEMILRPPGQQCGICRRTL
jgi:hypothetical protein